MLVDYSLFYLSWTLEEFKSLRYNNDHHKLTPDQHVSTHHSTHEAPLLHLQHLSRTINHQPSAAVQTFKEKCEPIKSKPSADPDL